MQPKAFKAWYASLPKQYQQYARRLYDAGQKEAPHTADSLALIRMLVEETRQHDANPIFKDYTA